MFKLIIMIVLNSAIPVAFCYPCLKPSIISSGFTSNKAPFPATLSPFNIFIPMAFFENN